MNNSSPSSNSDYDDLAVRSTHLLSNFNDLLKKLGIEPLTGDDESGLQKLFRSAATSSLGLKWDSELAPRLGRLELGQPAPHL